MESRLTLQAISILATVWWRAEGLAMLTPHSIDELISISISPGVFDVTLQAPCRVQPPFHAPAEALRVANTHLASHDADQRIAKPGACAS